MKKMFTNDPVLDELTSVYEKLSDLTNLYYVKKTIGDSEYEENFESIAKMFNTLIFKRFNVKFNLRSSNMFAVMAIFNIDEESSLFGVKSNDVKDAIKQLKKFRSHVHENSITIDMEKLTIDGLPEGTKFPLFINSSDIPNMTALDFITVVLHEIGHVFKLLITYSNTTSVINSMAEDFLNNNGQLDMLKKYKISGSDVTSEKDVMVKLYQYLDKDVLNIKLANGMEGNKTDAEYDADNFVAMFGLGGDLAKVLNKLMLTKDNTYLTLTTISMLFLLVNVLITYFLLSIVINAISLTTIFMFTILLNVIGKLSTAVMIQSGRNPSGTDHGSMEVRFKKIKLAMISNIRQVKLSNKEKRLMMHQLEMVEEEMSVLDNSFISSFFGGMLYKGFTANLNLQDTMADVLETLINNNMHVQHLKLTAGLNNNPYNGRDTYFNTRLHVLFSELISKRKTKSMEQVNVVLRELEALIFKYSDSMNSSIGGKQRVEIIISDTSNDIGYIIDPIIDINDPISIAEDPYPRSKIYLKIGRSDLFTDCNYRHLDIQVDDLVKITRAALTELHSYTHNINELIIDSRDLIIDGEINYKKYREIGFTVNCILQGTCDLYTFGMFENPVSTVIEFKNKLSEYRKSNFREDININNEVLTKRLVGAITMCNNIIGKEFTDILKPMFASILPLSVLKNIEGIDRAKGSLDTKWKHITNHYEHIRSSSSYAILSYNRLDYDGIKLTNDFIFDDPEIATPKIISVLNKIRPLNKSQSVDVGNLSGDNTIIYHEEITLYADSYMSDKHIFKLAGKDNIKLIKDTLVKFGLDVDISKYKDGIRFDLYAKYKFNIRSGVTSFSIVPNEERDTVIGITRDFDKLEYQLLNPYIDIFNIVEIPIDKYNKYYIYESTMLEGITNKQIKIVDKIYDLTDKLYTEKGNIGYKETISAIKKLSGLSKALKDQFTILDTMCDKLSEYNITLDQLDLHYGNFMFNGKDIVLLDPLAIPRRLAVKHEIKETLSYDLVSKEISPILSDKNRYVYHIGAKGYDKIRPLSMQKDKNSEAQITAKEFFGDTDKYESYTTEISSFISNVKCEHVSKHVMNGFDNWGGKDLYVYKIDLLANEKNINGIGINSSPQETIYNDKYWDKFYKDADKKIIKKYGRLDSDEAVEMFRDLIKEWKDERSKYLFKEYGIKDNMSVTEYLESEYLDEWKDIDTFVDKNIKDGQKTQYASYIPHLAIQVNKPLVFEEVTKIC